MVAEPTNRPEPRYGSATIPKLLAAAHLRFAPAVFTFGPEWCSPSLRNAVQLGRNPQQHVKLPSGELPESVHSHLIHAVSMVSDSL
jgi:hypothetical protein